MFTDLSVVVRVPVVAQEVLKTIAEEGLIPTIAVKEDGRVEIKAMIIDTEGIRVGRWDNDEEDEDEVDKGWYDEDLINGPSVKKFPF